MKTISIDIETMPNTDMLERLPEVKPDTRLKDEEKIKADIEKKKADQIEKMALNPLYGKIAAVGYYNDEVQKADIKNEAEMIEDILGCCLSNYIVTWNGKSFDFDFIIKRGVILGVCDLKLLDTYASRYAHTHFDLMEKWCGFGKFLSLNEISYAILGEKKEEFDVKQIPELIKTPSGQELIKRYCLKDCELVYKLADKFGYLINCEIKEFNCD